MTGRTQIMLNTSGIKKFIDNRISVFTAEISNTEALWVKDSNNKDNKDFLIEQIKPSLKNIATYHFISV